MRLTNVSLVPGTWTVESAKTPEGKSYAGTFNASKEGEAWRCEWKIVWDETRCYTGVGLSIDGMFVASRGPLEYQYDTSQSVGIVVYNVLLDGTLPAHWYHPDLKGKVGSGVSINGPKNQIVGNYIADYKTAEGENFETLKKRITKKGSTYYIEWLLNGNLLYYGIGMLFKNRLVVGWAPPGIPVEIVKYDVDLTSDSPRLSGAWACLKSDTVGYEKLTKMLPFDIL
ncbi:MAG: hypothetical protein GY874_24285 [Desulfobacteraceae bacterium]|nr:hypothetical protein [Desulfobacteraceae bacterium]